MSGEKATDWDALRAFMPTSFGKQAKTSNLNQEFEKTKREAKIQSSYKKKKKKCINLHYRKWLSRKRRRRV